MSWVDKVLDPAVIAVLIPIVAIVGGLSIGGLKMYLRHQERLEKIRHGIDPDRH